MARPERTPAVPAMTALRPAALTADRIRRRGMMRSPPNVTSSGSFLRRQLSVSRTDTRKVSGRNDAQQRQTSHDQKPHLERPQSRLGVDTNGLRDLFGGGARVCQQAFKPV